MANGSVVQYEGKRGTIYRLKYRDASGKQVQETIGSAAAGWTLRKAQQQLKNRLADVDREGYVKPETIRFERFARRYLDEYLPGRNLKHSTVQSYRQTIETHLIPFFGSFELKRLEQHPDIIDGYVAAKTKAGLSAKTISNHLALLGVIFKRALTWKLISTNPMASIERPRVEQREMSVLSEGEVAKLIAAFDKEISDADESLVKFWRLARAIVFIALATGLRRGELLGLRWRDIDFDNGLLHVREAIVLGRIETPKSKASRRTIELAPRALSELEAHRRDSAFRGADERVFCHPLLGTPADPSKLSKLFLKPALEKAKITKPFRPFHDLRHTAITHEAAAGNPQAYIQLRAGHSSGAITERYIHAAQVMFPGAATRSEARVFSAVADPDPEIEPAQDFNRP